MTPSFTRGEYWLLEAVVERRISISLAAADDVTEVLNKSAGHGLSRALLADTFVSLLDKGLIEVMSRGSSPFVPDKMAILAAMDQRSDQPSLSYGLTSEGGRQWELFALPVWSNFIDGTFSYPDRGEVGSAEYVCASKERLEHWFELAKQSLYVQDQPSASWDVVQPWQATYWKILPIGHRVRFRGSPEPRQYPTNPLYIMWNMERWYAWK